MPEASKIFSNFTADNSTGGSGYRIGLALSGGSAKGFAHIGVLRYMEEHGLKPDIIAGTSAGALVAALYADGYSPEEMEDLFCGIKFKKMTEFQFPQFGLFATSGFKSFLRKHLRHKRMQDLNFPLYIVATDLDHGRSKYFTRGPLVEIVTASCSIPVLFSPVRIEGTYYVDGGLFKNLPASVIRRQCNTLVGVHLNPDEPTTYKKNLLSIAERSFNYTFRANALPDRELCDVLIESQALSAVRRFDTNQIGAIAHFGYELAEKCFALYRPDLLPSSVEGIIHKQINTPSE